MVPLTEPRLRDRERADEEGGGLNWLVKKGVALEARKISRAEERSNAVIRIL